MKLSLLYWALCVLDLPLLQCVSCITISHVAALKHSPLCLNHGWLVVQMTMHGFQGWVNHGHAASAVITRTIALGALNHLVGSLMTPWLPCWRGHTLRALVDSLSSAPSMGTRAGNEETIVEMDPSLRYHSGPPSWDLRYPGTEKNHPGSALLESLAHGIRQHPSCCSVPLSFGVVNVLQ